ncbi:BnaA01g24490D [Brassica napus]|uniref:BnaA01g24490D protein n=1 Tax=Brassica napus TaxID=3708 RepID=A0A078H9A6_BRANA|nr:BnaA01g24490D [Brassica napus]
MASSLTLLDPTYSFPHSWKHHVFPSFHGEDVRKNFLSHILKEFRSKGIDLFIDNDIERKKLGQTVISLFYEVDPTDVKKQTGKTKSDIKIWKQALVEVAKIAGYHSRNWFTDAEMIKDIATDFLSSLKFSYDALNHEDKLLFLHIACFFNGEQVDIVEGCLAKCFLDVTQGLRVLAEKSLISMESRAIQMAELLVHLGRKNVLEQSVSDPGKRQFLNGTVDIGEVLSDDKAVRCSSVIGIDLKEEEDISCTSERSFERLTNLQFLRISGNGINPQSLNYISQKLRVLVWSECSFSDLEKLWDEIRLPDLSTATNLQELDLSFCSNLEKLPFSIGNAINLRKLDLKSFSSLVELPSSIGNAVNLKTFLIFNCTSLLEIPSTIATITNLKSLRLSGCSNLVELPFNIESVTNAMCIDLRCCSSLMKLPSSIGNAIYLQKLDLSHCSSLVKLPSSIGNILSLEELKLSYCSSLVELPSSMKNLGRLSNLKLEKCLKLVILLANINLESLGYLNLSDCSLLKSYPKISTDIQELDPWTGRISSLQRLVLSGMKKLLNQKPLGISTKFKACIICADGNENGIADGDENGITDLVQTVYCSITSEGNALTACHKRAGQVLKGHLYIFEVEVETEEMTSTELVFEFLVGYWHIYEERINSKTWEIKECGVLQLQEVPLLSIRDVNEDNEPSYTEIGDKPWNPSKTEKHQEKKSKITGASSGI